MEPITHFLTGACLGRAGLNRKTALATLTCTLAAEAPDIDVVVYFVGPVTGFAHHRGMTHTFLGVPFVAALVVGFVWLLDRLWLRRRRQRSPRAAELPPPRWAWLYLFAVLAGFSHILLDFTNNYGVRPFSPFLHKWWSWDIVFIVEPILWLLLIGGLVLPSLFRLISEEIGARSGPFRGRAAATAALVLVVVFWAFRDFQHRRAVAALEARTYNGADPIRVSAFPYPINPFRWYAVVETRDFFQQVEVDSLTPEVDPQGRAFTRFKPEETEVTLAAKRSRLGQVYLDWAQYPITETERLEDGWRVRFFDLRFDMRVLDPQRARRVPLGASVLLDPQLNVVEMQMGRGRERPDD